MLFRGDVGKSKLAERQVKGRGRGGGDWRTICSESRGGAVKPTLSTVEGQRATQGNPPAKTGPLTVSASKTGDDSNRLDRAPS